MRLFNSNLNGFSLIEVMISIVVLSFGLLGVGAMQVSAVRTNSIANKITNASTILQDKIETLMALPFNHADLIDTTDLGLCEQHTEPTPLVGYTVTWCVENDASGTKKTIDLATTWLDSNNQKNFTLSFVRSTFQN